MKKKYNLYEYIEIDTKDISDIEKYWPQMRSLGLSGYEHTARDVRTVGTWYAYSEINDTSNARDICQLPFRSIGLLWGRLKESGAKTCQSDVETFH